MLSDKTTYNQGLESIANRKLAVLKFSLNHFGIGRTGSLLKALRVHYKKSFGEIEAIGFRITKGGVMTEKGVGGVSVDSAKSNGDKILRKEKPWFTPILDDTVIEVADYVASKKADAIVKGIKI